MATTTFEVSIHYSVIRFRVSSRGLRQNDTMQPVDTRVCTGHYHSSTASIEEGSFYWSCHVARITSEKLVPQKSCHRDRSRVSCARDWLIAVLYLAVCVWYFRSWWELSLGRENQTNYVGREHFFNRICSAILTQPAYCTQYMYTYMHRSDTLAHVRAFLTLKAPIENGFIKKFITEV